MRVRGSQVLLSGRESEVLSLLYDDGLNNRQTAERLGISPHTASSHVAQMMRGLEINSRCGLTLWAAQHPRALFLNEWTDRQIHRIGCMCLLPYCTWRRDELLGPPLLSAA